MVIAPGLAGSSVTVLLKEGEKLPRHLNSKGVLAFRVIHAPHRKWVVIKTPDFIMSEEELTPVQPDAPPVIAPYDIVDEANGIVREVANPVAEPENPWLAGGHEAFEKRGQD